MRDLIAYARDGVAFPVPVLSAEEVAHYAAHVDSLEPLVRRDRLHLEFDWARELIAHPRLVAAVSEALGAGKVEPWGTLMLRKPPHDESYVAWHQDGEYATFLGGARAVSAWIALTDSTRENGCMRVVPRSHAQPLAHVERHAEGNLLSRGQELAVAVDESEAVDVVLHAGEMSLHDINLVHGSGANRSASPRIGFIVRYRAAKDATR
jgi:ectoine hydroxylase-related dioxygenase (phytanoyl-CoA dioxygenase family)